MSETNILRVLGVSALALAFVVTVSITVKAGSIGGDNGDAEKPAAATTPAPAAPAEEAPQGEAAPAEPAAAPEGEAAPITLETQTYVIEGGDSFSTIADKFGTSIAELQRLNPTLNPQNLSPGTEMVVPKQPAAGE